MFPNFTTTLRTVVPILFASNNVFRTITSIFSSFVRAAVSVGGPIILIHSLNLESSGGRFEEQSTQKGLVYLGIYGTSFALMQTLPKMQNMLTSSINIQLSSSISQKIVTQYFQLPFDDTLSTPVGKVGQLIGGVFMSVNKLIPAILNSMIPAFIESIAAVSILSVEVTDATAPILGSFLIVYIIAALYGAKLTRTTEKERALKGMELYGEVIKILLNYENVHYFGNENFEIERFNNVIANYNTISSNSQRRIECSSLLQSIIIGANFITLMVYSGYEVYSENADLTDFFLINLYAIQFSTSISRLADTIYDIHSASSDFEETLNFLSIESSIQDAANAQEIKLVAGQPPAIEFKNVSFSYIKKIRSADGSIEEKAVPALENLNFAVEAGKTTAIIGFTGAGKTTILRLLFRFYDLPKKKLAEVEEKVTITINNQDIRTVTLSSLRELFSVIPQNPIIMQATIGENIRYGNFAADDKAVNLAVEKAGLTKFINSLPGKLNTIVGEHGLTISGGQRQQIAIARAILKNGPIFLLDEATSATDPITESELQSRLDAELKGKTVIMIAHRLNQAVTKADKIIVLEQGKIVEQGSFSTLMSQNGLFKKQMTAYRGQDTEQKQGKQAGAKNKSRNWMATDRSEAEEELILRLSMLTEARADILRKFAKFGHTGALDREFENHNLQIAEIESNLKGEEKAGDAMSFGKASGFDVSFSFSGRSPQRENGAKSRSQSPPVKQKQPLKPKHFPKIGSDSQLQKALLAASTSSSLSSSSSLATYHSTNYK